MSTRMVILGLLRERPLYGYELKHIIAEHMGDWTDIAFGSIYYALGKLESDGHVEKVATEQEGNRPSRTVYRVTDSGRVAFLDLMRETWQAVERQTYDQDLALFFLGALPAGEVVSYLQARTTTLRETLVYLDRHRTEQMVRQEVPLTAGAILDHTRLHIQAELAWTERVLADLQSGRLS